MDIRLQRRLPILTYGYAIPKRIYCLDKSIFLKFLANMKLVMLKTKSIEI